MTPFSRAISLPRHPTPLHIPDPDRYTVVLIHPCVMARPRGKADDHAAGVQQGEELLLNVRD